MKANRKDGIRAEIDKIIARNSRLTGIANAPFDPVTGEGSTGRRRKVAIADFPTPVMYLPVEMMGERLVKDMLKAKTVRNYMRLNSIEYTRENTDLVVEAFVRVRIRYDFPFWAFLFVRIKPKGSGGVDVPFRLRPSQRKLVEQGFGNLDVLERPIRLIILKARQWGGSTCVQIFMAWLQLVHAQGLNSLIIAQGLATATEIQEMFRTAISLYPAGLLHPLGGRFPPSEAKWAGVGSVQNIHQVPQRRCKIKIGSVERPDSCRGGDYNLVHCSEVGVWKKTDGKEPEDIIDAATGGMGLDPMTMIVYESTAKGTGNFFHREWVAAKEGRSQFKGIFIPWYDIPDRYWKDFADEGERRSFAERLYQNRNSKNVMSDREEPGEYLWWLWTKGATLEGINWYIEERRKYRDHGHMASEYPTDDVEAFVHSGARVFDKYQVDAFRADCRAPMAVGDVAGKAVSGKEALKDVRFVEDHQGLLWVWQHPETFPGERVMHRYLVTVDIGGRGRKADWSVISVLDRYDMMEGGLPAIAAQWRGHTDHDLLAWKAAQVAAYYDNALLVIESNTLETKDQDRSVDGDQSGFILNQIKDAYGNLYARASTDEEAVAEGAETRYGFHTNTKTKPEIISHLIEVVRERLYVERDSQCLDEYLTYELSDGRYNAIAGCHDDLLMTRAIGLWICYRVMPLPRFVNIAGLRYTATAKV